jgi:hypothetical protein
VRPLQLSCPSRQSHHMIRSTVTGFPDKNSDEKPAAKVRWRKYTGVRLNDAEVADDLRNFFFREVESTTPEVLKKLRDSVLPEYIRAREAIGMAVCSRFSWPKQLGIAVLKWAREVHLLYNGKPPDWVVEQVEATLFLWDRQPALFSTDLCWGLLGGYSMTVRPREDSFTIELPKFRWDWERGFESSESAKKRILADVAQFVDVRMEEMKQELGRLPRVPNKLGHNHVKWTVLHQIRRVKFHELAVLEGVSENTIKNEVTKLKKCIGINLPKGRRRKIVPGKSL